jgi:broad specificity phosphatase PhoE
MRIFLIRHGETTGDVEDRYGGDYDDNLTDKGLGQAKELANKLTGKNIQIVVHSPRIRAKQTAEIVATVLKIQKQQVEDLRERNHYGILTGMTKFDAMKKYPEEVQKLNSDGIHSKVKNSEVYDAFKKRITSVFNTIVHKKYDCIAIISHGGVIRGFMREIAKAGELLKLGDCGIIELEVINGVYKIVSLDGVKLEANKTDN